MAKDLTLAWRRRLGLSNKNRHKIHPFNRALQTLMDRSPAYSGRTGLMMRDLYELFRDGVIEDALAKRNLQGGSTTVSPWQYVTKDNKRNVGRLQTLALVRRFMAQCADEYPGGISIKGTSFIIEDGFLSFVETHREMKSTNADMVKAWAAMQDILS